MGERKEKRLEVDRLVEKLNLSESKDLLAVLRFFDSAQKVYGDISRSALTFVCGISIWKPLKRYILT